MGKGVRRDLVNVAMLAVALLVWFVLWDDMRDHGNERMDAPVRYIIVREC